MGTVIYTIEPTDFVFFLILSNFQIINSSFYNYFNKI